MDLPLLVDEVYAASKEAQARAYDKTGRERQALMSAHYDLQAAVGYMQSAVEWLKVVS